jgi:hypothetical protein
MIPLAVVLELEAALNSDPKKKLFQYSSPMEISAPIMQFTSISIENINHKLDLMSERLTDFSRLPNNWNGYGAQSFSPQIIDKAKNILNNLTISPDIFATGRNSIQFEYEKDNGDYLEFEVFQDRIKYFSIKDAVERDGDIVESELDLMVDDFYA